MGAYADETIAVEEPILESPYPRVSIPALTVRSGVEFILKAAAATVAAGGDKWLTNSITGETLTFSDVEPMSKAVGSAMKKRGMVKGDVALYLTSDVTKIYPTIIGIWRVGGIMYSSYPEDTQDALLMRIEESKAKWVFCDYFSVPQVKAAIAQLSWDVEIIVILGPPGEETSIGEILADDGADCPKEVENASLDDPVMILCTSGTTGKSKGAVYTNKSLLAFCLGTNTIPKNERPELKILRVTHVLGLLFPVRNIYRGTWAVMMHQVTKENIFKAVDTYKPVLAFGFPTFLILLAVDPDAQKIDRSSLEVVIAGGMMMTQKFIDAMMTLPNMKAVLNGFGMTECGALTTTFDLSGVGKFVPIQNVPPLSVGRLYPNTSLKILHLDTGRALGPNEKGEITIRSPILCSGYWNRPEETERTFVNGWMRTGDLGFYDENGFVFLVDRIKETFKYFNNHISPTEIEEVILHHPDVAEASVYGVEDPNGGDHIPRAVVVLKPGVEANTESIREFTDNRVAEYKKLRGGVYVVEALPRGKTGKVMRSMVAEMTLNVPNAA